MFFKRFEERFVIENADGSGAQLPGQKLFASSTLINARFENISCASGAQCAPPSQPSSRPSSAGRAGS